MYFASLEQDLNIKFYLLFQSLILSPSYREAILRNLMTDQSSESDNVPYNTESLKRSGFKRMLSAAKRMALARRG